MQLIKWDTILIWSLNLYKFNYIKYLIYYRYPQQKIRFYRCRVCSKSFDSRINCLDHIHKDHNQPTSSTSNRVNENLNILTNLHVVIILFYFQERESEDSRLFQPYLWNRNHPRFNKAETPMGVDKNQQDNNKCTVDMHMMLNDNVHWRICKCWARKRNWKCRAWTRIIWSRNSRQCWERSWWRQCKCGKQNWRLGHIFYVSHNL